VCPTHSTYMYHIRTYSMHLPLTFLLFSPLWLPNRILFLFLDLLDTSLLAFESLRGGTGDNWVFEYAHLNIRWYDRGASGVWCPAKVPNPASDKMASLFGTTVLLYYCSIKHRHQKQSWANFKMPDS